MMNIEVSVWSSIAKAFFVLAVSISLFSCAEEEIKAPENLIPEEEMVDILVDLNLIESVRSMHITQEKDNKIPTEEFYNYLWQEKEISKERFTESFDYYRMDAKRMSEIYQKVADDLKRKEDLLNEKNRQDIKDQGRE